MSDGTHTLRRLDPDTFAEIDRFPVTLGGSRRKGSTSSSSSLPSRVRSHVHPQEGAAEVAAAVSHSPYRRGDHHPRRGPRPELVEQPARPRTAGHHRDRPRG
ncbi:hypothetical protein [Corynebacterium hylobatis]|uniref:hypothetical protein n=1 Tax=Corynebacterium hylobatis TaxID=1859290 RepID=UPI003F717880